MMVLSRFAHVWLNPSSLILGGVAIEFDHDKVEKRTL